jgi:predicted nucleotidyltransferase
VRRYKGEAAGDGAGRRVREGDGPATISAVSPYATADLDALLAAIRAELPALRRMGVLRIGIFGSRARGSGRADSDVDVLVEFDAHRDLFDLIEVKQHLESVLGLAVDVTTPSGIRQSDRPAIMGDLRYAA